MICLMLSKLPGNTREKWDRNVMNVRRRHLRKLAHFVDDEATLANDPLFSKDAFNRYVDKKEAPNRRKLLKTYLTAAEEKTEEIVNICQLCQKSHDLDGCLDYKKESVEERSKFLFQKKLYTPKSSEHNVRICKKRRVCYICRERHSTGLYGYKASKKNRTGYGSDSGKNNGFLACATTKMTSNVVSMCVVPGKIKCNKSRKVLKAYAMLDCCSQGTFINSELAKKLRTEDTMTTIKVKTLNGKESQETEAISGLKVTSLTGKNEWIYLPVSYTRENLLVGDEDIATPDQIKDWKYLERIADKIIQKKEFNIGLLIGGNCSKALEPLEVIPSKDGGPCAFRTLLGWYIVGPIGEITSSETVSCNKISVQDMASKTVASHYFTMETEVKVVGIKQMLHKMYAADFSDHCPSNKREDITEMSVDDRNFITPMEKKFSNSSK